MIDARFQDTEGEGGEEQRIEGFVVGQRWMEMCFDQTSMNPNIQL